MILLIFPGNHTDQGGEAKIEKMPSSRYRYEDLVSQKKGWVPQGVLPQ